MDIIVGAPIRRREWIASQWVDHVAWATIETGIKDENVSLMFVAHPDDPTIKIIEDTAAIYGLKTIFLPDDEEPTDLKRNWKPDRLKTMVRVRNTLLEAVREEAPSLFLSLDSDILIHKHGLREMIKMLHHHKNGREPVASSHCVNLHSASTSHPNYAMISKKGALRRSYHEGQLIPVDVIMAAKLMTPTAYAVDYVFDKRGEDIGWSSSVREQGNYLAWSGRVVSKHCMNKNQLETVDPRCGY